MQTVKLCGIYILWDDWDWLELNLKNSFKWLDEIIIVWSQTSNFGEYSPRHIKHHIEAYEIKYVQFEPDLKNTPAENERLKRNIGLDWAKKTDCTHFLMMDVDEFYTESDLQKGKEQIGDLNGLIAAVKCYFRIPTLTIGMDTTLVPFIHKLTTELEFKWNTAYPFAWVNKQIRIDPTRQLNISDGVMMSDVVMHHMSWVRKNVNRKIQNSTAKMNLLRSSILTDYCQAKEGYFCEFYKKRLEACPNIFGLPELIDEDISI